MPLIEMLGFTATLLINVAYVPQVIQTIRTKNVKGLSLPMFIVLIVAGTLWTVYGILIHNYPVIVCNSINVIQSCIILYYKVKYN